MSRALAALLIGIHAAASRALAQDPVRVVTTLPVFAELVKEIGGDKVTVEAIASPPTALISSTTDCAGPASLPEPSRLAPTSLTTTRAPSAASSMAMPRPMPRPAPVTIATLPATMP